MTYLKNVLTRGSSAFVAVAPGAGTVSCDTGDVRYLGNIATTTKAGIYKTTIAYIAVPTF